MTRSDEMELAAKKQFMIARHLVARGIHDQAVLRAMREVPRESFVPCDMERLAYEDSPLPIEEGQTISQPYMVAYMTEALQLTPRDRVLEIGTGTGYAAAVVSMIAAEVHTVERIPALAQKSAARLRTLGYRNIAVHLGDGTLGWPEQAPYQGIVVTAGAPDLPDALLKQLAISGRLVIPVGGAQYYQTLLRVLRVGEEEYLQEELCAVRFVPLIGEQGW